MRLEARTRAGALVTATGRLAGAAASTAPDALPRLVAVPTFSVISWIIMMTNTLRDGSRSPHCGGYVIPRSAASGAVTSSVEVSPSASSPAGRVGAITVRRIIAVRPPIAIAAEPRSTAIFDLGLAELDAAEAFDVFLGTELCSRPLMTALTRFLLLLEP